MANKHSGFKLIGNIDADSKKIENLPDPTADQEPATKIYADKPVDGNILRSVALGIAPGETPGTQIDVVQQANTSYGFNGPTITGAYNLDKEETQGSFSLDVDGEYITMDITEVIVGLISWSIYIYDLNSSSTSEMYFLDPVISGGNLLFYVHKRGSVANVDWTSILDSGDSLKFTVSFTTSS